MWWNDVASSIRENMRVVLIGALGVILVSSAIGFVAGTVQKKKAQKALHRAYQEERVHSRGGEFPEMTGKIPIPDPIIPKSADSTGFILYDDRYSDILDKTEMDPGKLSDLLSGKGRGLSVNFKPFVFKGEEMDILTDSGDIVEP